jgi:hypothetical protein
VIAITNLIEYGINSLSVTKCIWGTSLSSREITGIVTIIILYRGGGTNGAKLEDLLE